MTETSKLLAVLMKELRQEPAAQPPSEEGWIRTKELRAEFGMATMGAAREIADRIVAAGFAERKVVKFGNVLFRLSPKFRTWKDAHAAQKASRVQKVPAGWMTLSAIALDMKRTIRGLQYVATAGRFPYKVYNIPSPTRHYQRSRFG